MTAPRFGGPWTEQKLEILQRYLDAYTTALKNKGFRLTYFDAFAGAGAYSTPGEEYREFNELRRGSPQLALDVDDKPFDRLIFVEKDAGAAESLFILSNEYPGRNIDIVPGDANEVIPRFCKRMTQNDRAVIFLDPYATEVSWNTVAAIAETNGIDCWILFPLMAVSRMMPTDSEPSEQWASRLDSVFGGRHWQESYRDSQQLPLFDSEPRRERDSGSRQIAQMYRRRLEEVFSAVAPTSRTLVNSTNSPLFELFFAVSNPAGAGLAIRIAKHILENW